MKSVCVKWKCDSVACAHSPHACIWLHNDGILVLWFVSLPAACGPISHHHAVRYRPLCVCWGSVISCREDLHCHLELALAHYVMEESVSTAPGCGPWMEPAGCINMTTVDPTLANSLVLNHQHIFSSISILLWSVCDIWYNSRPLMTFLMK